MTYNLSVNLSVWFVLSFMLNQWHFINIDYLFLQISFYTNSFLFLRVCLQTTNNRSKMMQCNPMLPKAMSILLCIILSVSVTQCPVDTRANESVNHASEMCLELESMME